LAIDNSTALTIDNQGNATVHSCRSDGHVYIALAGSPVGGTTVCLDYGMTSGQKVLEMSDVYMRWYSDGDTFSLDPSNSAYALVPDYTTSNYAMLALEETIGVRVGSKIVVTGGHNPPAPFPTFATS